MMSTSTVGTAMAEGHNLPSGASQHQFKLDSRGRVLQDMTTGNSGTLLIRDRPISNIRAEYQQWFIYGCLKRAEIWKDTRYVMEFSLEQLQELSGMLRLARINRRSKSIKFVIFRG